MDIPVKQVYFGTPGLFEFTELARRELIDNFQTSYPDQDDVPFVGYDPEFNAFFLKTDNGMAIRGFQELLNSFINYHLKCKNDLTESPKLVPLPNTTNPEQSGWQEPQHFLLSNVLVDPDNDSDDSTENASSGDAPCDFWQPACGDISILPSDIAKGISTLTGSYICAEPDQKRCRLLNGDVHEARGKLTRMEPLFEHLARHRSGTASRVDYNLVSLSSPNPGTGVCFVPVAHQPHCDRVMVDKALEDPLEHTLVCEERVYNVSIGKHTKPENLKVVGEAMPAPHETSQIWSDFGMPLLGNPENALPRTPSGSNSIVFKTRSKASSAQPAAEPSRFLPLQEQARLHEWSKNVDPRANPDVAAELPNEQDVVEEEEAAAPRYVADSDSDIEPVSTTVRKRAATPEEAQGAVSKQQLAARKARAKRVQRRQLPQTSSPPLIQQRATEAILVTSDDFFAGVPRDNDTDQTDQAQQNQQMRTSANAQRVPSNDFSPGVPRDDESSAVPLAPVHTYVADQNEVARTEQIPGNSRTRRGFGYDGADDDVGEHPQDFSDQENDILPQSPQRQVGFSQVFQEIDEFSNYEPEVEFDPLKYGASRRQLQPPQQQQRDTFPQQRGRLSRHNGNKGSGHERTQEMLSGDRHRNSPSQVGPNEMSQGQNQPVPPWPRLGQDSTTSKRQVNRYTRQPNRQNHLIDLDEQQGTQADTLKPPPGLTLRSDVLPTGAPDMNILDEPLDDIQRPSIKPNWEPPQHNNDTPTYSEEDTSHSASHSSGGRLALFEYTPQINIVRPDVNSMRNQQLAQLLAAKQAKKNKLAGELAEKTESLNERIADDDELSSRRFHESMNLRAPNPGKIKKKSNSGGQTSGPQESAAEKQKRIAAAKAEIGLFPATKPKAASNDPLPRQQEEPHLTRRAQQAAKTNAFAAETHKEELLKNKKANMSRDLLKLLTPMLNAARSFSGELEFEMQIGQLLTVPSPRFDVKKIYDDRATLEKIFGKGRDSQAESMFSNILTSNGAEIDGILGTNTKNVKTWSKGNPGPITVVLEFQCQDNEGIEFKVQLSTSATYEINKGPATLGKVGIQCTGRFWDMCAVLKGTPLWYEMPETIPSAVEELVSSVCITPGPSITVHFRPPSNNSLVIHDVVARRISLHNCQVPGEEDLQLKVTERKLLYTKVHRIDKRLHWSTEKPHEMMALEDRVHYEVSIVHHGINAALLENKDLKLGEMTSGAPPLDEDTTALLVNSALRLVDKMDGVGQKNYGTLRRQQDNKIQRQQELAMSRPPTVVDHNLVRPLHMTSGYSVAGPRTAIGGRAATAVGSRAPQTALAIHGVRAGTRAEILVDRQGNCFMYGQGGARIPLGAADDSGINDAEVIPGESASQAGGRRVPRSAARDDRPPGFW